MDPEEKCICGDKRGWHHAKPTIKNLTICYGIACMCRKFVWDNNVYTQAVVLVKEYEKISL